MDIAAVVGHKDQASRRDVLKASALMAVAAIGQVVPASGQAREATPMDVEVAIVGGGPAGLSAALVLGRSRRRTVVFDAGRPRNATSPESHGVFTRDGATPAELLRLGREQLRPYPSVEVIDAQVVDGRRADKGFVLDTADGTSVRATNLILATGVIDELPDIPGLRETWGTRVLQCPYCHGWEVRDRPFLLIAQDESKVHFARILRGWTDRVVVCPVVPGVLGTARPDVPGIELRNHTVKGMVPGADGHSLDVTFDDGTRLASQIVFYNATLRQRSPLPAKLGCRVAESGMAAGLIETDQNGATGVPGLYVAGDASAGSGGIVNAIARGAAAAASINAETLLAGR